jgi:hypothetical protein
MRFDALAKFFEASTTERVSLSAGAAQLWALYVLAVERILVSFPETRPKDRVKLQSDSVSRTFVISRGLPPNPPIVSRRVDVDANGAITDFDEDGVMVSEVMCPLESNDHRLIVISGAITCSVIVWSASILDSTAWRRRKPRLRFDRCTFQVGPDSSPRTIAVRWGRLFRNGPRIAAVLSVEGTDLLGTARQHGGLTLCDGDDRWEFVVVKHTASWASELVGTPAAERSGRFDSSVMRWLEQLAPEWLADASEPQLADLMDKVSALLDPVEKPSEMEITAAVIRVLIDNGVVNE